MTAKSQRRLRILITAGPTIEYLDSVRFLSNGSSGKTGYAIAEAAARAGHRVTLVSGPVERPRPSKVRVIGVTSAREMLTASRKVFSNSDAAVFSAAVCDYRPLKRSRHKRPKSKSGLRIELISNPDIAETLGRRKGRRVTIGFALEDFAGRQRARQKLMRKRFDAIILNSPGNIGSEMASAEIYRPGWGWNRWPRRTKRELAASVVRLLEALAAERSNRPLKKRSAQRRGQLS